MTEQSTRRILEINDVALSAADASGILTTSPGQIICGDAATDGMLVGRAASERRRINPRATHDRFWSALDQTPLPHPAGPARSNADLVWVHLREMLASLEPSVDGHEEDRARPSWTLVVPAAYDDEQLALLLGIARSLGLEVDRLVSAPVAAAVAAAPGEDSLVVDAHWHRFSADLVGVAGNAYRLDPDGAFDGRGPGGRGLGALFDTWAALVTDAFVAQTRFDPSHDAVIEQRVYNSLPGWLAQMARGEDVAAELDAGTHRYRAELSTQAFVDAAEPFYRVLTDRIEQAGAGALVVRHRLAGLPGLAERLAGAGGGNPFWLDDLDVARCVLEMPSARHAPAGGDTEGAVPLTLQWTGRRHSAGGVAAKPGKDEAREPGLEQTRGEPPDRSPQQPAKKRDTVPTHVLIDGHAVAIDRAGRALSEHWRIKRESDGPVVLVGDPAQPESQQATINGDTAGEREALESGDRVAIGNTEFMLLRVEDGG